MLEITRVFFRNQPIPLYLMGIPMKPIKGCYDAEKLFAVEMSQVLIALGLLSPKPEPPHKKEEVMDWCEERQMACLKYGIPGKLFNGHGYEDYLGTYMEFRYIACLRGALPQCDQFPVVMLAREVEDIIETIGQIIGDHFERKTTKSVSVDEEGKQVEKWLYNFTSPGEYIRVVQSAILEKQLNGGSPALGYIRSPNSYVPEKDLAAELKISQTKLRDKLVFSGLLEKEIRGLKAVYVPTNIGSGYCDSRRGRSWHRSILKLLDYAG